MTGACSIDLKWADGTYTFHLRIGEWRELKKKTGAGPPLLYRRVLQGEWEIDDVREVIRLGLIGGGTDPMRALELVEYYVDQRPLLESVETAVKIMKAAMMPLEVIKKKRKRRRRKNRKTMVSASQPFTATVQ